MTPKQERFVAEYLVDLNATQAAIRAGYSEKTANEQASRLLADANIGAEVAKRKAIQLQRADLTAAGVLEVIRRHVHGDIRKLFNADGQIKPISELTEEEASLITGFDATTADVTPGEKGPPAKILKIKIADRTKYVEMAAKHFALLTDVVRVEGVEANIARLTNGRKRAAEGRG